MAEVMANDIVINSEDSDFKKMIFKLMGRGLSTSVTKSGSFTLNYNELSDLLYKIQQRVEIQNNCVMADFLAEFTFSDGSKDRIPSFEEYQNYKCTNRHMCVNAKIKMAFLVQFKGRSPEKQSIDIILLSKDINSKLSINIFDQNNSLDSGQAEISIEYTDVTWANDIKGLFIEYTNVHINQYIMREKIKRLFSDRNIFLFVYPLFIIMITYILSPSNSKQTYQGILDNIESTSANQVDKINRKLDILILKENTPNFWAALIPTATTFISIISIWILANYLLKNIPRSGIILSDEAKTIHQRENDRINRKNALSVMGILVSIGCTAAAPFLQKMLD